MYEQASGHPRGNGRRRSFMQRMERLCYGYDAEGRAYVRQLNRVIPGFALVFMAAFGVFLVSRGVRRRPAGPLVSGSTS